MKKILIGSLVGTLIMFIWSFLAWMILPIHANTYMYTPAQDNILKVLQDGFGNPKYAPCPLLVNMVLAGKLGAKSGEGFYIYTAGSKEIKIARPKLLS